jgi:hypothetical protein
MANGGSIWSLDDELMIENDLYLDLMIFGGD